VTSIIEAIRIQHLYFATALDSLFGAWSTRNRATHPVASGASWWGETSGGA
jgi:hypothetical protein